MSECWILVIKETIMSAKTAKIISDFSETECLEWYSINDIVMGGRSRGALAFQRDSVATFSGYVSFENNGGFASVKSKERKYQLEGASGIKLLVNGDGKTYKLRLRTTDLDEEFFFEHAFKPQKGEWETVSLKFKDFYLTRRGRRIDDAPQLIPENIVSFGLLISDRQEGEFKLEIDSIEAEFA